MWISGFPSTICWRDYSFHIAWSQHSCWRSFDHICESVFLGPVFCSVVCRSVFWQCHTVLIIVSLCCVLKSGSMRTLFFFFKIDLTIWNLLRFLINLNSFLLKQSKTKHSSQIPPCLIPFLQNRVSQKNFCLKAPFVYCSLSI